MDIPGSSLAVLIIFLVFSIPVCIFDIKYKRIPNWIVFTGTVFLFAVRFFYFQDSPVSMLINMLSGGLMFYTIRFFTKGKLGMGDVKFAAFIALFLGFPLFFAAVAVASFTGLVFAVAGLAICRINKSTKIPFAPFLTAGSIIVSIINIIFL
ncbi:MAG: prepilin peptidase [Spirochaetaceae bacterium]|nr:prepilin peptidase [Spirochaetaceae bacterium]